MLAQAKGERAAAEAAAKEKRPPEPVEVDRWFAYTFDDIWQFCTMLLALLVVTAVIVPQVLPVLLTGLAVYGLGVVAVDPAPAATCARARSKSKG